MSHFQSFIKIKVGFGEKIFDRGRLGIALKNLPLLLLFNLSLTHKSLMPSRSHTTLPSLSLSLTLYLSHTHPNTQGKTSFNYSRMKYKKISCFSVPNSMGHFLFSSLQRLTVNMFITTFSRWLDLNLGPLVSEVTALPNWATTNLGKVLNFSYYLKQPHSALPKSLSLSSIYSRFHSSSR